ncbi:MAG: hypothetical protein RI900_2670, partial [Actinomycetota bacterium]
MTRRRNALAALFIGVALSISAADVVSAAPASTSVNYTVKAGDGLTTIAVKLKVSLADLLSANKLTLQSVIWPGMTLVVPGAAPAPTTTAPKPAPAAQYTVQSGDSILV